MFIYDNSLLLFAAIALLAVWGVREYLLRYKNINMDDVNVTPYARWVRIKARHLFLYAMSFCKRNVMIDKQTGDHSLFMIRSGNNKATVMATLRQITGVDYGVAKNIVESAPAKFMVNVSAQEAEMTKKALEYVGAEIYIE